eukprot:2625110-Amphidinium_carterae.1
MAFARYGFRGRIWANFIALLFEGLFLLGFGSVTEDQGWALALGVLVCFSMFVQAAEGTGYGIVPFMNTRQLAVVSALVGAGGNFGAVLATQAFYRPIEDELLPFKLHGAYVVFWALMSPVFYWPQYGGMFHPPKKSAQTALAKPDVSEA